MFLNITNISLFKADLDSTFSQIWYEIPNRYVILLDMKFQIESKMKMQLMMQKTNS